MRTVILYMYNIYIKNVDILPSKEKNEDFFIEVLKSLKFSKEYP